MLLRDHGAKEDWLTRAMNAVFGRFFKGFNKVFQRGSTGYGKGVQGVLRRKGGMLAVYAILLGATVMITRIVPGGFVPRRTRNT
jgi:multidrug efflux pump